MDVDRSSNRKGGHDEESGLPRESEAEKAGRRQDIRQHRPAGIDQRAGRRIIAQHPDENERCRQRDRRSQPVPDDDEDRGDAGRHEREHHGTFRRRVTADQSYGDQHIRPQDSLVKAAQ